MRQNDRNAIRCRSAQSVRKLDDDSRLETLDVCKEQHNSRSESELTGEFSLSECFVRLMPTIGANVQPTIQGVLIPRVSIRRVIDSRKTVAVSLGAGTLRTDVNAWLEFDEVIKRPSLFAAHEPWLLPRHENHPLRGRERPD